MNNHIFIKTIRKRRYTVVILGTINRMELVVQPAFSNIHYIAWAIFYE